MQDQEDILQNLTLGEESGIRRFEDLGTLQQLDVSLITQARRRLTILTPDLEPARFNATEFVDAVSHFVRSHRDARVRILVQEPRFAIQNGHRLIPLVQRLTSQVNIRRTDPSQRADHESWLIADGIGLIHLQGDSPWQGYVDARSQSTAARLEQRFSDYWEQAQPIADMRRLML